MHNKQMTDYTLAKFAENFDDNFPQKKTHNGLIIMILVIILVIIAYLIIHPELLRPFVAGWN